MHIFDLVAQTESEIKAVVEMTTVAVDQQSNFQEPV